MKINEIEKRYPVELEDPGTIEVQGYGDQQTASVINMQVISRRVHVLSEFMAKLNTNIGFIRRFVFGKSRVPIYAHQ